MSPEDPVTRLITEIIHVDNKTITINNEDNMYIENHTISPSNVSSIIHSNVIIVYPKVSVTS